MPRKQSLHLDLGAVAGAHEELPPLAALFLIHFDTKKGYTIEWSRSAEGVDLDGVEFKGLPSGLHRLEEDLVYFVHGHYAGVSAFLNVEAGAEERGALMVCAGALVPLSYGRLGRSWRHAEGLKGLTRRYTKEPTTLKPFEQYYEQYQLQKNTGNPVSPVETPHGCSRSISETRAFVAPGQKLSQFHPALSLCEFVQTFGPLVFPIYRAALARKRILLVGQAPVEMACNFVYDISILSNIPLSVADLLPAEPSRLKPLFNIGVHDIPLLEEEAKKRAESLGDAERGAWVACTTDEILSMKRKLWDVIIHLPAAHTKQAKEMVWPTVETNQGTPTKATQRDLRRFRALVASIKDRYRRKPEDTTIAAATTTTMGDGDAAEEPNNIETVCEKLTWSEIAVSSFMWWASAGEQRCAAEAEDGRLLIETHFAPTVAHDYPRAFENEADGNEYQDTHTSSSTTAPFSATTRRRTGVVRRGSANLQQESMGSEEMDLIAYFHRMTQRVFSVLADSAQGDGDDEEEQGEEEEQLLKCGEVQVSLGDLERMGLDRYSDSDAEMVAELVERWWGRSACVERGRINCCGVKCG